MASNGFTLRVGTLVLLFLGVGIAAPVALHFSLHGAVNVHQIGMAFFLWLNVMINLWEFCLLRHIDLIEQDAKRYIPEYKGRELQRIFDFFGKPLRPRQFFASRTWSEVWSSYAVFDPSYADKSSFGFWIDVGNGFSTLLPALFVLYGMTFQVFPAWVLGLVGLLMLWQMFYGTVVYFSSYLLNRRYKGHTVKNLIVFVGMSNLLWMVFPIWGAVVCLELLMSNSYAVLG